MHFKTLKIFLLSVPFCGMISACTPIGVATSLGAVGGVAVTREGGLSQSATDTRINLEISDLWFKYDINAFSKLNLTVEQGRVLVTGVVQDPDMRVEAIRLAWQPKGVKQVINEVRIENSDGITGYARDAWISSRLRSKLIFDRDIQSINYTIDTVQGTVYLMGIAQDQSELNKVVSHARATGFVRNVVSYVKMAGEPIDSMHEPIAESHEYRAAPAASSSNTSAGAKGQDDYNHYYDNPPPSAPVVRDNTVYSEPL